MLNCKLYPEVNGKDSELFKTLIQSMPREKAKLIYAFSKTNGFKDWYNGEVDKNGEPVVKYMDNGNVVTERPVGIPITIFQNKDGEVVHHDFNPKANGELSRTEVNEEQSLPSLIEKLQELFGADVIYDSEIDSAGMVLPLDDSRSNGRITVVLNPEYLGSESVIHEFAHVFIDLAGGITDDRIVSAINVLRNTPLWDEVAAQYPELNEIQLGKEVLATAIGIEGSKIFAQEHHQNWWNKFVTWLFDAIKEVLPYFKPNLAKQLAKELTLGSAVVGTGKLSNEIQQLKFWRYKSRAEDDAKLQSDKEKLNDIENDMVRSINSVRELTEELKRGVKMRLGELKAKGHDDTVFYDKLQNLSKIIAKSEMTNDIGAIFNYVLYANSVFKEMLNSLKTIQNMSDSISTIEASAKRANLIRMASKFMDMMEPLKNMSEIIESEELLINNSVDEIVSFFKSKSQEFGMTDEKLKKLKEAPMEQLTEMARNSIDVLLGSESRVKNLHKRLIRITMAELMTNNSTRFEGKKREQLEREFGRNNKPRDFNSIKEYKYAKQRYVDDYFNDRNNIQQIKDESYHYYLKVFDSMPDISSASKFLNPQDINSDFVQVMFRLISNANFNVTSKFAGAAERMKNIWRDYEKEHGKPKMEEMYEKFLGYSNDGEAYLRGQVKIDFFYDLNKLRKEKQRAYDDEGKNSDRYKEASKKLQEFKEEHISSNGTRIKASSSYVDTEFNYNELDDTQKAMYDELRSLLKESDNLIFSNGGKLTFKLDYTIEHAPIRLPAIGKTTFEKLQDLNVIDMMKLNFREATQKQEYDEDFGQVINGDETEQYERLGFKEVYTDVEGVTSDTVPIHFRAKVDPKRHSLDLPSLALLNFHMALNHREKTMIEPIAITLLDSVETSQFRDKRGGFTFLDKNQKGNKTTINYKGKGSNVYYNLKGIIDHGIYGISTKPMAKIFGMSGEKLMQKIGGYTGSLMMSLNYMAAGANLAQGKISATVPAAANDIIGLGDMWFGERKYFSDMMEMVKDTGKVMPDAETNILSRFFHVQGDEARGDRFSNQNALKVIAANSPTQFINQSGEHYVHNVTMYAVLNAIKVRNKDLKWIDSEGNVVENKEDAASIYDMITIENNEVIFSDKIGYTSIDSINKFDEKGHLQVANLIKKINSERQGEYDTNRKSVAQQDAVISLAYMFRKWLAPGLMNRYRGAHQLMKDKETIPEDERYFSQDAARYEEGYVITTMRFINGLIKELRYIESRTFGDQWWELTDYERSNIKKAIAETAAFASSLFASMFLYMLANMGDEDRDTTFLFAYYFKRVQTETAFWVNPLDALKILQTPAASISVLAEAFQFLGQLISEPTERYERGDRKGQLKVMKEFYDLLPGLKQVRRDVKDSYSYLTNVY